MKSHNVESDHEPSLRLALNYLDQGLTVINQRLELIVWNDRFLQLLDFPSDLIVDKTPLSTLFLFNAERGEYGDGDINAMVAERIHLAEQFESHCFDRVRPDGTILEVKGNPIDNGNGFVTVYTDVTDTRRKQAQLANKVVRRSNALQRETQAHRNAIAVLQESERCIRQMTGNRRVNTNGSNKEVARVLAQSEALIHRADEEHITPSKYTFDRWQLDISNRQLLDRKTPVELSPTEFDLLSVLVRNAQSVLSRDDLLKQARGRTAGPNDRSVDVHVAKLRKIFNLVDNDTPVIRTVRNSGYMLARDVIIT